MGASLKVTDLNLHYGAVQALYDVSFEMPQGRLLSVMGRNGVGKTSLARALTGRQPISNGQVLFGDSDIAKANSATRAKAGVGYVPQGREIFPLLSVRENLETGYANLPKSEQKISDEIYALFPILKEMHARRGGDLSGGQQQQLAIGRAMVISPKLLILDEPTEGIQPSIIKDIGRAITYLKEEFGMTILLIEQYFDFAWELADDVLVLDRGRVVAQGAKSELVRDDIEKMLTV